MCAIQCTRYDDITEEQAKTGMLGWGMDPLVVDWTLSLSHVYKQCWGAGISPDVQLVTGHAPQRFADFVAESAAAWRRASDSA